MRRTFRDLREGIVLVSVSVFWVYAAMVYVESLLS